MIYQDLTPVACKRCGSDDVAKYGHIRSKQRFRCKGCGYTFTLGDERTTEQIGIKKAILLILHVIAGATFHELGRIFNMCPSQVFKLVVKSGFSYPKQNMNGSIEQINLDRTVDVAGISRGRFDKHKPVIIGQGELIPGYNAMVMIQTPDGKKIKAKSNPFHEYRTLPHTHRW